MNSTQIRIQSNPFDPFAEQDELRRGQPQVGALVAFVGLMRDINEDANVCAMTLEHYPGMTERALADRCRGRAPLAARRRADCASGWSDRAGRTDRARRGDQPPSWRCLPRLRADHRLPQDRGAVLEEGADRNRRALGRGARARYSRPEPMAVTEHRLGGAGSSCFGSAPNPAWSETPRAGPSRSDHAHRAVAIACRSPPARRAIPALPDGCAHSRARRRCRKVTSAVRTSLPASSAAALSER